MIDTHCHLTDASFRDRVDEILAGARAAGVRGFVVPSVDIADSIDALDIARGRPDVRVAVGIHPMWADFRNETDCRDTILQLSGLIKENTDMVVAVGEIGLDPGSRDDGTGAAEGDHAPSGINPAMRRLAFVMQMKLAREFALPVIIHSRGSVADLVEILESLGPHPAGGVLHAFNGSAEIMDRLRPLGYLRGVAGSVTRPDATRLAAILGKADLKDIVLETDAPFIANCAHRRGDVVPADVALTAAALARLTGRTIGEVVETTDANARRLFGIG